MKPQKVETNNGNQGLLDRKNVYVEKSISTCIVYFFHKLWMLFKKKP